MDADRLLEELDAMGLEGVFAPATPIQDNPFVDFINNLSLAALIGSALLAVFVALLVGVVVVSLVRSRLREPSAAIQRIYFRMLRDARRAGYNASAALTPWELGRELSADLFPTPGSGAALAGSFGRTCRGRAGSPSRDRGGGVRNGYLQQSPGHQGLPPRGGEGLARYAAQALAAHRDATSLAASEMTRAWT